jgi:mitotic-spindle organizing protein 1
MKPKLGPDTIFGNRLPFTFLLKVVEEIAALLKIGLDKETLSICVRLIENGINPSTLAHFILEIQKEATRSVTNK